MKCNDIAKEFGITSMTVGRKRKVLFPKSIAGTDLTPIEAAALRQYYEELDSLECRKELEELVKPKFVDAYIGYIPKTGRHVMCKTRLVDGTLSEPIVALMPFNFKAKVADRVRLEYVERDDGVKQYRHEYLAGRAWGNVK